MHWKIPVPVPHEECELTSVGLAEVDQHSPLSEIVAWLADEIFPPDMAEVNPIPVTWSVVTDGNELASVSKSNSFPYAVPYVLTA